MEMVIVVTLGVLALAIIGQQNDSMRYMKRVRIEKDEREQR